MLRGTSTYTVSITDDDDPPVVVSFAQATGNSDENANLVRIVVEASRRPAANLIVNINVSGTAVRNTDFSVPGTVTINRGQLTGNLVVNLTDDTADEDDETVILTLQDTATYDVGATSAHTLTIDDNDVPLYGFSAATSMVTEGNAVEATVTVTVDPAPFVSLNVPFSIGGTAAITEDYTLAGVNFRNPDYILVINADETEATFTVSIVQNDSVEVQENIIFTLGNAAGEAAARPANTTHTVVIDDDDMSPLEVSFASAASMVAESVGTAMLPITLNRVAPAGGLSVSYRVSANSGAAEQRDSRC